MNDPFININNNPYIKIDKDIRNAIINNRPIVALESTLISHGFPYPQNFEIAKSQINAVKKSGSLPATIGIINGKIKIGLKNSDIQILAKNKNVLKVSKHNLTIAMNKKINAATTVASTIYIASKIGIKFFATGGIGGVHLESEKTFDISSDLTELAKTRMNVICSGAKSILDINKTYEKLETSGIPRIGYKSEKMPGFWYHQTNKILDYNFINLNELVEYLKDFERISESWSEMGSVLIFNPIPKNKSLKKELVDKWINESLKKAKENSIEGKDLTPYLIKIVNILSKNKTLKANMELIINNALFAGKLANKFYSN